MEREQTGKYKQGLKHPETPGEVLGGLRQMENPEMQVREAMWVPSLQTLKGLHPLSLTSFTAEQAVIKD
jgi:hypothetical protein